MSHHAPHDLPEDVTSRLPTAAQEVYREAFDDAWKRYGRNPRDESRAHAVAWAAVKERFHESEQGEWKEGAASQQSLRTKPLDDRRIF